MTIYKKKKGKRSHGLNTDETEMTNSKMQITNKLP